MEDLVDIPEDSMRHVEALLARHPPHLIQRMFAQTIESRRNSVASSFMSIHSASTHSSSSSNSSWRSHLSMASTSSTLSASSDMALPNASLTSSRSRMRRTEPRSYPVELDPTRSNPALLTSVSNVSSPLEMQTDSNYTPTDDISIASPVTLPGERSQDQTGESCMFCTYCAEQKVLKTFKAKSDWKKHETRMHETGENWPCIVNGCNRIFDRQKDFIKHHQRYHSGQPLPSLTDIGITLLPRKVFGCGFNKCKEVSIGWDERCDHVAKHMKNGTTDQWTEWKYSNVIRNLMRQGALHGSWKELIADLDERLWESRSRICWSPDNTRILRQKLQCCDLRPSREEVLITAMSLRSDIVLDHVHQLLPAGFVVPSRDSIVNVEKLTREQRMHILNGNSNTQLYRTRLASINAALLRASIATSHTPAWDCRSPPYNEPISPVDDTMNRRISYMDVDPAEFLDLAQPAIPDLPSTMNTPASNAPHPPVLANEQYSHSYANNFTQQEPPTANPLGSFYPSYFDAAPQFEESQYYDRRSLSQMISRPLQKIGSRFSTSRNSPDSVLSSQTSHPELNSAEFAMQTPVAAMNMRHFHQQPQQQQQVYQHPVSHAPSFQYHNSTHTHDPHSFPPQR
ncbi:hypothetical protein P153DRAFT_434693 [Dothidotthia symphoricarpi CBS 119687]|uniref:C2H2-type domain-containing protein n=1 Tax=Dothidotthia symphoricarpi CBS 119687 TaxID=1392245 RepID=A0A6A6A2M7_9PLEO|nr:uncharacterized protein P153DRAFT_434693 [Dothidotthia symphoricarpi CBS 119687]KAF2124988.1 hypothetical protein P153DRAFT_434693 [Dothidotthia symphoricarpi CBS 119687]